MSNQPEDESRAATQNTMLQTPSSARPDADSGSTGLLNPGDSAELEKEESPKRPQKVANTGLQLNITFACICVLVFAASLDATIITTSLPSITTDIGGEAQYVWIANSLVITSTAVLPTIGQLSNIFGRRVPLIVACSLFILGSAIAGAAQNVSMLIGGRVVQGLGTGGVVMLTELITSDLVPQRERAKYLGMIGSMATIATMLGPVIGGALAESNWRWVFFINIPLVAVPLAVIIAFVQLKYNREPSWQAAVARIDYFGGALFIASIIAIMLGLVMGGTTYLWSSWHIIVPLVLGFLGWIIFHLHQASRFCKEPTMPPRLFTNRTSFATFLMAFLQAMLLSWILYFLPIYFQAVKGSSATESGVDILPFNAFFLPAAIISGGVMSRTGVYRPLHAASFAFLALGVGLFSILDQDSNRALWVIFQLFTAIGIGFGMSTVLPAIQGALPESDVAAACATYSFLRNFGQIWGITIPSVTFNSQINAFLYQVSDEGTRNLMANGGAYSLASRGIIHSLPSTLQAQVIGVYEVALQRVWQVAIAFSLLGFLLAFVEKHLQLRTELETEFGIDGAIKKKGNAELEKAERIRSDVNGDDV